MEFIILTLTGIIAILTVNQNWKPLTQTIFITCTFIAGTALAITVTVYMLISSPGIPKSSWNRFDEVSWFDILLYFIMLLGMASKYIFDKIGDKKRKKLRFNKFQFFKPFLVSPIIFGSVYSQIPENASLVLLLVFSYQNGFFWQTILYKEALSTNT